MQLPAGGIPTWLSQIKQGDVFVSNNGDTYKAKCDAINQGETTYIRVTALGSNRTGTYSGQGHQQVALMPRE